jgi:hypothetical protein
VTAEHAELLRRQRFPPFGFGLLGIRVFVGHSLSVIRGPVAK